MASIKTITVYSENPWRDGLVKRRYQVVITDNNAVDQTFVIGPFKVLPANDGTAEAADFLERLKDSELSASDIVPAWNDTQADYDRRSLGYAMTLADVTHFLTYLPLFQAMESRSGNNAIQRAATLGVSQANYTAMQSRFNDAVGIAGGVETMNSKLWTDVRDFV